MPQTAHTMSSGSPPRPTREETVSRALNEHGFLFQARIAESFGDKGHWKLAATEFPVSLVAQAVREETRIDLVLERHERTSDVDWYLTAECKRANPDFKTWIFFNERGPLAPDQDRPIYFQGGQLLGAWNHQGDVPLNKRLIRFPLPDAMPAPIFNYYLEARENPPARSASSASTKTIEEALFQVTAGAIGLTRELHRLQKLNFRVVPIIVTTAEIFAAEFPVSKVSLDRGELNVADLKLQPLDWAIVNYAISETMSKFAALTSNPGRNLAEQLSVFLLRSVFVVRAPALKAFLTWFDGVPDRNPQ